MSIARSIPSKGVKETEKPGKAFTYADILALPEGKRAEVIDGHWYDLAAPRAGHQRILGFFYVALANFLQKKGGSCEAFIAPFAVFLPDNNDSYVEPDLFVVCDAEKVEDDGCHGAPDLIVEVLSPSTERKDMAVKLFKYRACGVREYWIVNPMKKILTLYAFADEENEETAEQYTFSEPVTSHLYPDFTIDFAQFDM